MSVLFSTAGVSTGMVAAADAKSQITILYDAFGKDASMEKDWGFSALVEVAGKRILFDTGNDRDIFAANVKAKNVDLTKLDFVVLSHRHSDHMAGLSYVLSVNPKVKIYAPKKGFGIYGSSLPSAFYRKDGSLPSEMRYYDGKPPEIMKFGTAWQDANFELVDKTTEVAPGVTLIALVSDAPGTTELKELSRAINTPDGVVLVVGCSHPGIERIVEAAASINPKIHLVAGGFHLVVAQDDVIAKTVTALKDTFKVENIAPGHCTGEPTFTALRQAFGDHYIYAGLGTSLRLGPEIGERLASECCGTCESTPLRSEWCRNCGASTSFVKTLGARAAMPPSAIMRASPERSTPLATERVERRLTAILAADVAGYSRSTGLDDPRPGAVRVLNLID